MRSARSSAVTPLRPALVCGALLTALDASEGRRRRRKRDTTPDAIGMLLKRQLLTQAIEADPDPDAVEAWLLDGCLTRAEDVSMGVLRAMARDVIAEWRLRAKLPALREALAGRFRAHHAFLVSQVLAHVDYLDEAIATVSAEGERLLSPFAAQVRQDTR